MSEQKQSAVLDAAERKQYPFGRIELHLPKEGTPKNPPSAPIVPSFETWSTHKE